MLREPNAFVAETKHQSDELPVLHRKHPTSNHRPTPTVVKAPELARGAELGSQPQLVDVAVADQQPDAVRVPLLV